MKLTERYIQLCRELADAGYLWEPRPGDWMLDITDESIGMLTTYIEKPERIRAVNVQIPYGLQITDLLKARGCQSSPSDADQIWLDREGNELYRCTRADFEANSDEESLAALVADYKRFGGESAA